MATRFYFDSTATPSVSPAFGSGWNLTTDTIRRRLNRTPQGSTMTDGKQPGGTGDQWPTTINPAGEFSLAYQYVVPGLAAQTISGTLKGQMRAAESASGANCTLAVRVAKAASDGSGVTEILAVSATDNVSTRPPEFLGVLTNAGFQDVSESFSLALSSTSISENDILIIEIGARSTSGALRGFSLSIGDDSGTDLPEDTTTTAANNPWIEFSGDITFAGEGGTNYMLAADPGSFAWTGTSASLEYNRKIVADSGTFTWTGTDATFKRSLRLIAEAGSFAWTGTAATFKRALRLIADPGAWNWTGTSANLDYSGAEEPEAPASSLLNWVMTFFRRR